MKTFGRCQRCEMLRPAIVGPGTLHLRLPLSHSLGKVLAFLKHSTWQHQAGTDGMVSIEVPHEDVLPLVLLLLDVLTPLEQTDVRAIFHPLGKVMQIGDYFDTSSLHDFVAKVQSSWLVSMLREQRITSVFQPIVYSLCGCVLGYECLMRGNEDDQIVSPGRMLQVATGADLLFQLDLEARRAAIREAARHNITDKIFINFTPSAIYDPTFCLRSTVAHMDDVGIKHDQVVFEVIESDKVHDSTHLKNICDHYRDMGFEIALDDLGSGYASLNLLHELRPNYIKLDMKLIRGVHLDPYKAMIAQKLIETAQALSIKTIAEGVEDEGEFVWAQEHGADYVQGYYIAKPGSPPPLQRHPNAVSEHVLDLTHRSMVERSDLQPA